MRCILATILVVTIACTANAQSYLSPQQKAVLDFYYAQAETNAIDGAWIILGTVPLEALETNVQQIITASVTNVNWSLADSNFAEIVGHDINITFSTNELDYVFLEWLTTNTYVKIESDPVFTNWLSTNLVIKAENYIENESQALLAASGFETITNFTIVLSEGITGTHSNLIPNISGDYGVWISMSFGSSTANVFFDGHLFTNGIEVPRIGWSRSIGTANQQGSAAGNGLINIAAGVNCELKIDTDKNTTIDFDHLSFMMIKQ